MGEYQQRYFGDRQITIISEVIGKTNLKTTARAFPPTLPNGCVISVFSELMKFSGALMGLVDYRGQQPSPDFEKAVPVGSSEVVDVTVRNRWVSYTPEMMQGVLLVTAPKTFTTFEDNMSRGIDWTIFLLVHALILTRALNVSAEQVLPEFWLGQLVHDQAQLPDE